MSKNSLNQAAKTSRRYGAWILFVGTLLACVPSVAFADEAADLASLIFQRLTGSVLTLVDLRRPEMEALIREGKIADAAAIAVEDKGFLKNIVRPMVSPIFNKDPNPYSDINDAVLTLMTLIRNNDDFRAAIMGTKIARGNPDLIPNVDDKEPERQTNRHYAAIQNIPLDFSDPTAVFLVEQIALRADIPDVAGVLTSRGFGEAHLKDGTNRRAVQKLLSEFMCKELEEMADITANASRIRQDVDRNPGGIPDNFVTSCKGCHSVMDGMGGAFAYINFSSGNNRVEYTPGIVQNKMNDKCDNSPATSYPLLRPNSAPQCNASIPSPVFNPYLFVSNDSWINPATENHNAALGWSGATSGSGINALGTMVANSDAFSSCMVKRVFKTVCNRDTGSVDEAMVQSLATGFRSVGYKMKNLFGQVIATSNCLGEE